MKTVFIIIPWFTPAYRAGGPIRSLENLVKFFDEDIQYQIFCGHKDVDGTKVDRVIFDEWNSHTKNSKVWYHTKGIAYKKINELLKKESPDKVLIMGIFSFHFNILPLLFCTFSNKIISVRGMLHPGALSQKKIKKRLLLMLYKALGIQNKVIFQATDNDEKQHIINVFGKGARVAIAGNFPSDIFRDQSPFKEAGSLKLLSVGLISPMKNYLMIIDALSHITGSVEYHIVGAVKDKYYWNTCLKAIALLPQNINVMYHGELPHDRVEQIFQDTHVLVLPSNSENYGHAIIESLSAGNPVITSHFTPWNQLSANKAGINVELNDNGIREAINYFISLSNEEFNLYFQGAKEYFKKNNSITTIKKQYQQLLLSQNPVISS